MNKKFNYSFDDYLASVYRKIKECIVLYCLQELLSVNTFGKTHKSSHNQQYNKMFRRKCVFRCQPISVNQKYTYANKKVGVLIIWTLMFYDTHCQLLMGEEFHKGVFEVLSK